MHRTSKIVKIKRQRQKQDKIQNRFNKDYEFSVFAKKISQKVDK